ncbi:CRP-like cAMP-binding protein [Hoeflea marina]|uniref:CRP-like cAMP-binding protein n=1 Tax=Hoeflea marina TaxID=274592 RepID=A0A317PN97_9HYPH|nr:Crp/Fnr family transcriptional regulator [Hoeflea marina]PWW02023.1 CRP-like cAMP-binding protein [Hoeflea marina]
MTKHTPQPAVDSANPLVARLGASVLLTEDEIDYLAAMQASTIDLAKGDEFVRDGEDMRVTFLVHDGWIIRYKMTAAGRRQIIGVSLPGDFIGLHINFSRSSTFNAMALTKARLALVEPERILEIHRRYPILASGLDWMTVRSANILSEHNVSLGARPAPQRILHFMLELWTRLVTVGHASSDGFHLRLSQEQIADCMGLSSVHANRSLRRLVRENLIAVDSGNVSFPRWKAAVDYADFDDRYLQPFLLPGNARLRRRTKAGAAA